jgi:hypothetical protein
MKHPTAARPAAPNMKRLLRISVFTLVVLLGFQAFKSLLQHQPADSVDQPSSNAAVTRSVHDHDYTPYVTLPPDLDPDRSQDGVGWVFGRLIGVAEAPGSGSHAPYRNRPKADKVGYLQSGKKDAQ